MNGIRCIKIFFYIFILFLPCYFSIASDDYDPTDDLVNAFGSTCSISGAINDRARVQGAALKGIINKLQGDKNCAGLAPLAENLYISVNAVHEEYNSADAEKERISSLISDLKQAVIAENAKGAGADLIFISSAESEIRSLTLDLIRFSGTLDNKKRINRVRNIEVAQKTALQLLSGLSNSKCAVEQPSLAGQIVGRVLSVSSLLNPGVYGAVSLGVGSLIEGVMALFRDRKFNKLLFAARQDQLMDGIGCGLEAIASTHCQARDALEMLNLHARNKNLSQNEGGCSQPIMGARLIGNLPTLLNWVGELKSSNSLSQEQILRRTRLDDIEYLKKSIANRSSAEIARIITEGSSSATIASSIEVINSFYSSTEAIRNFFPEDPLCGLIIFFYSEGKLKQRDPDHLNNNSTCISYIRGIKKMSVPSLDSVKRTNEILLGVMDEYVFEKRKLLAASDPTLVMARGDTKDFSGRSPIEILQGLKNFFQFINSEKTKARSTRAFKQSIKHISEKLQKSFEAVDNTDMSDEEVSKVLIENIGDDRIPDMIREVMRLYVEQKRASGEFSESAAMVMELSNVGGLSELMRQLNDIERTNASAQNAKTHTHNNLNLFVKTFEEPWSLVLENLAKKSKNLDSAKNILGLSCMRAILAPSIPKYVQDSCSGSSYRGIIAGNLDYNHWKDKPYLERVCSIYDYFKKASLIEKTKVKLQAPIAKTAETEREVSSQPSPPKKQEPASVENQAKPESDKESICSAEELKRKCYAAFWNTVCVCN